ncbi:MAG: isoprenylcysteine carboxylmethyltransferase family protein [Chloroflexi bacterium]|nr:isoprenylcysteine carboxylmethyltransferase family protein [Chloroflexota bacterium]
MTHKNARRKVGVWDRYADFVYRVATGNKKLKILTTPAAVIIFFGLVVLFVFASFWLDKWLTFLHFGPTWWSLGLSWLLIILGWLIMFWPVIAFFRTRGTPVPFNPPPKLITTGPYAYIRNPMLLGLFVFMLGLGILFGSLSLIFIFTPLFIALNVFYIKAIEEMEMEKKFGKAYLEYKKKVPMFFPGLKKWE